MVTVQDERLPGTLYLDENSATAAVNGNEVKLTAFDVLIDTDNQLLWQQSTVPGGIPRDSMRGGYNKDKLQYFIARAVCPDGTLCCGQYVPHEARCCYAWNGMCYNTDNFEFLCKK